MTIEQQDDISYRFQRFVKRYEVLYAPQFNKALREQVDQYVQSGTLMAITAEPIYRVLLDVYKSASVVWAHQSALQIRSGVAKSRQPLGFSQRIIDLMKKYFGIDLLNIAQGITETTKRWIGEVLAEATQLGWSFNAIVAKLQAADFTRARARLIARTEVVSAANAAATINAKETAGKTGIVLNKIWIATRDNRTRLDHREVDRQIIGIDDTFIVGGFRMSQPGDRTHGAGAAECCNCRCCVSFIPV